MKLEDKVKLIEEELDFLLDAPFMETAKDFPSPEDVIEDWYLTATVFRNVRVAQNIPNEHREALSLCIDDAVAEFKAAQMLGEAPDTEEVLGVGYDGYDVPDDFAANHQAVIWKEVLEVFGADTRGPDLTIVSE